MIGSSSGSTPIEDRASATAFVIAAAILYIPANYFPVLTVISAGAGQPSTIIGGVKELLSSQMYPLALLVFFASILVPLFMLWYYRFSGMVANIALVLNMLMLVAIMIAIKAA